jgi:hypothetical protein
MSPTRAATPTKAGAGRGAGLEAAERSPLSFVTDSSSTGGGSLSGQGSGGGGAESTGATCQQTTPVGIGFRRATGGAQLAAPASPLTDILNSAKAAEAEEAAEAAVSAGAAVIATGTKVQVAAAKEREGGGGAGIQVSSCQATPYRGIKPTAAAASPQRPGTAER